MAKFIETFNESGKEIYMKFVENVEYFKVEAIIFNEKIEEVREYKVII